MAAACLRFGRYTSALLPEIADFASGRKLLNRRADKIEQKLVSSETSSNRTLPKGPRGISQTPISDCVAILLGILFYIGALLLYFLGPHSWRNSVTFPLLLGPPGTMLRYSLSKLNPKTPFGTKFPIGTFSANILATAVIAATYAVQRAPGSSSSLGVTGCHAMNALSAGFCGCLSTVSTFAVEASTIKSNRWRWSYVLGSVVLGHLIVLTIVGGTSWSSAGLGPSCAA